jgi:hypothetical protein
MNKPLDIEVGKQIIDAVNRLSQLDGTDGKIITLDKNLEAEKNGLREYVRNQLFEHAGHLLGCWFAVRNEYEPLCQAVSSLLNRAAGIDAQRKATQSALSPTQGDADAGPVAVVDELAPAPGESELVAPPGTPLVLKPHRTNRKK